MNLKVLALAITASLAATPLFAWAPTAVTQKTLARGQAWAEVLPDTEGAALIRAAVMLGALCGELPAPERAQLDHFAKCIGLAFQVVDDVLDAEASTATLGKTAGKDAQQNKPTYVSVLGVAQAKALADSLRQDGLDALAGFGRRAQRLRELADFIVLRSF